MTDRENKLIEKACEWLSTHDSYATPTNVKVEEMREFLTCSLPEEPVSKVWHDASEKPEDGEDIVWLFGDNGIHISTYFKSHVYGGMTRWAYKNILLNLRKRTTEGCD